MNSPTESSKIITWGGYLALTLLLALPLSILYVRSGMWQQGLVIYALCCVGATLLLAVFALCMALPRFATQRRPLMIRSLASLPGTALFLSLLTGGDYPAIHDITTDTLDPPLFTQAQNIRGKSANSLDINAQTLQLQVEGYPDIKAHHSTRNFADAFARATDVAKMMGWEISYSDAEAGIIEAVDTTAVMAFKDDIVIRLRRAENGTRIDLRSVSRVGVSDMGANAKRIRAFLSRL